MERFFICIPDGCGIWDITLEGDTTNITLSVIDSRINIGYVEAGADQWNGISSQINISAVGTNLSNPTCTIEADDNVSDDMGGYFSPNISSTLDHSFTEGEIVINSDYLGDDPEYDRRAITHEIGHLVGLDHPHEVHPACQDICVMQYPPLDANQVSEHDRRALLKKWGY